MQESFLIINFHRPGNLELVRGEAACTALRVLSGKQDSKLKRERLSRFPSLSFIGQYDNQSTDASHTHCLLLYSEGTAPSTNSLSAKRPTESEATNPTLPDQQRHGPQKGSRAPLLGPRPGRGMWATFVPRKLMEASHTGRQQHRELRPQAVAGNKPGHNYQLAR